jgi:hypothetical protein
LHERDAKLSPRHDKELRTFIMTGL